MGVLRLQYDSLGRCLPHVLFGEDVDARIHSRRIQIRKRCTEVTNVAVHCGGGDVVFAGFSYGATTALLTAHLCDSINVKCVLAIDGWYWNGAQLPIEIHNSPDRTYPTYFLTSEMFAKWEENFEQVKLLVEENDTLEIVPGINHEDFAEGCFWSPIPFNIQSLGIGNVDKYYALVARTIQYLNKQFPIM